MSCQDLEIKLHAHLDGELDSEQDLELEQHLKGCPACSRAQQEYRTLQRAMASPSLYFKVPSGLERKVRSALSEAALHETVREKASSPPEEESEFMVPMRVGEQMEVAKPTSRPAWRWSWNWTRPAWLAPFAVAALMTVVTLHSWTLGWTEDQRVQEIVSAHVRSLMGDHLLDVPSSDQHTVKPWFSGKLNYSPPVIDPTAEGFPLIGGRLDYVTDSPTAAVVYQRRKHYINLFISPANQTATTKEGLLTRHGYNMLHWLQGGMEYWAVSDVNKGDLQQFVQLVRGEDPAGVTR